MSSEPVVGRLSFLLRGRELLGVYLLLKREEAALDDTMLQLLDGLERRLYGALTIEQFENVQALYERSRDKKI